MSNGRSKEVRFVKCPKCSRILPEPEHIPVYACGGCGTALRAKYYNGNEQDAAPTSSTEDVQTNGITRTCDGGESSGSSRRSSSSSEQSSVQMEGRDEKVAEGWNLEQAEANNSLRHASLSDKQVIGSQGKLDEEVDRDGDHFGTIDRVVMQKEGQCLASNSASRVMSSTKDQNFVENKEEKLPTEMDSAENGSYRDVHCDGIAVWNQGQIREFDLNSEPSMSEDFEVIDNKDQLQLDMVNEARQVKTDQHEQWDDMASDKPEVGPRNAAKVVPVSNEFEPTVQFALGDLEESDGSYHEMPGETEKITPEYSGRDVAESGIHCLDADMQEAEKLGKEDVNGEEHNNFIVCIREQLESTRLSSEASSSTDMSQDENENLLPGIDASLERSTSQGASAPSTTTVLRIGDEKGASSVAQDGQRGVNAQTDAMDISSQAILDSDVSDLNQVRITHDLEISEPAGTLEEVGSLIKLLPRSPTKGSFAYDGSVSSFDGNDDQAPYQLEHVYEVTSPANEAEAGYASIEGESEWNNRPSSRTNESNLGIQHQVKSSSSKVLREKLKRSMVEEEDTGRVNGISGSDKTRNYIDEIPPRPRVPVNRRSSEMAFETGSSSSYVPDELPSHWARHHPYRYEDPEPWPRRAYMQGANVDRRRSSEVPRGENEYLPMYYHNETSGEIYHKPKYQGYNDQRRRTGSWSQSGTLPRTQYSGEVFNGRCQVHDPYRGRHPDLRWSVQLPPSAGYYRPGPVQYMAPSRETSWDQYDPYSTSPPRFQDPESYAWTHDARYLSDDQRFKDHVLKRMQSKEKRQTAKKHLRPVVGGAPFISCYFCFSVLHMPEHFLLSPRRRKHRLKCSVCSKILEFSLENESCLAPSMPDSSAGAEADLDRNVSAASSHKNGRELHQHNSFGALGREKSKLRSESNRNGARTDQSRDAELPFDQHRQVKVTWQLPARTKSPLHRLMGYSSPTHLLSGQAIDDSD